MKTLQIIGYLGADAKLHQKDGKQFLRFSVGISQKKNGVDHTTWIAVFSKYISLQQYLKKGIRVYVSGAFETKAAYSEQTGKYEVDMRMNSDRISILTWPENMKTSKEQVAASTWS